MKRIVRAIAEDKPGPKWQDLFRSTRDDYLRWFLREGDKARPTYAASIKALRRFMPELVPLYEKLLDLAGGGDRVARLLSLYKPTPYLAGCSQVVWTRDEPILIRNYDYRPDLWEANILSTAWHGHRVIAMNDCLWGALDGINAHGLVVSLTFGGRKIVGDGFGIPLILRYILETCQTTRHASEVLHRVPAHMAYNVSIVDRTGDHITCYVSPGHVTIFRQWPISTNHQDTIDWKEYVEATASLRREDYIANCLKDPYETADRMISRFLDPPLYSNQYQRGHGTLYTAVYRPVRGDVLYIWPGTVVLQTLNDFREMEIPVDFSDTSSAPVQEDTPTPHSHRHSPWD